MATIIFCTSPIGKAIPNYFFLLADALALQGHQMILITDQNRPDAFPPAKENLKTLSWPSKRPTKLRDFLFFYRVCKKYKPDVTLGQFGSTNIVLLVSKCMRVPIILNYWHTMFDQVRMDSTTSNFKRLLQQKRKKIILHFCATYIFTNSYENKKDLSRTFKISPDRIPVFHYLIPDNFRHSPLQEGKARERKIVFVARLDKSKGHAQVLYEMPALLLRFPGLQLFIIGEGKERQRLENLCSQLKIENNVVFTGPLSLTEVYAHLATALIHVSASSQEAFGLVNAEALSAGTPILANKVGGIREILEDGVNGYFFNPEKQGDFVAKASALLTKNWPCFSQNARHSFLQNFSASEENIRQQVHAFHALLQNSPGEAVDNTAYRKGTGTLATNKLTANEKA